MFIDAIFTIMEIHNKSFICIQSLSQLQFLSDLLGLHFEFVHRILLGLPVVVKIVLEALVFKTCSDFSFEQLVVWLFIEF